MEIEKIAKLLAFLEFKKKKKKNTKNKKTPSMPEEFKVNGLIYHQNSCLNAEPVGNGRLKSKPKTLEKRSRFCNILKMLRMEL